jgi:hypothetical protein
MVKITWLYNRPKFIIGVNHDRYMDSVTHSQANLKDKDKRNNKEWKNKNLNRSVHPSVHKGRVDDNRDGFLWF